MAVMVLTPFMMSVVAPFTRSVIVPHRTAPCMVLDRSGTSDIVVIGAGIGGLSAAAMLAKYGYSVTVCESHDRAGGAAHGFSRKTAAGTFHFDSGPSLFSGCSAPSDNPLRQVLDAVGESPEWVTYNDWQMYVPEGQFNVRSGSKQAFGSELSRLGGEGCEEAWWALLEANRPLAEVVGGIPPIALRADTGAVQSALLQYFPRLDPMLLARFGAELLVKGIDPSGLAAVPLVRLPRLRALRSPRRSDLSSSDRLHDQGVLCRRCRHGLPSRRLSGVGRLARDGSGEAWRRGSAPCSCRRAAL
jgi:hypothetical protein